MEAIYTSPIGHGYSIGGSLATYGGTPTTVNFTLRSSSDPYISLSARITDNIGREVYNTNGYTTAALTARAFGYAPFNVQLEGSSTKYFLYGIPETTAVTGCNGDVTASWTTIDPFIDGAKWTASIKTDGDTFKLPEVRSFKAYAFKISGLAGTKYASGGQTRAGYPMSARQFNFWYAYKETMPYEVRLASASTSFNHDTSDLSITGHTRFLTDYPMGSYPSGLLISESGLLPTVSSNVFTADVIPWPVIFYGYQINAMLSGTRLHSPWYGHINDSPHNFESSKAFVVIPSSTGTGWASATGTMVHWAVTVPMNDPSGTITSLTDGPVHMLAYGPCTQTSRGSTNVYNSSIVADGVKFIQWEKGSGYMAPVP